MSGPATRMSLFVTLGIAAIDMLSCAFVSSILLFIMFLIPQQAAGGGTGGSENLLVLQWTFEKTGDAVLAFRLLAPNQRRQTILTDDLNSLGEACSRLSKANACKLITATSGQLDGMLLIQKPVSGDWDIEVSNSDTSSHGNNKDQDGAVSFRLTIVGKSSVTLPFDQMPPGPWERVSLRLLSASDRLALHVDGPSD